MARALTLTAALLTASFAALAQGPSFDVVSIKRNTSGPPGPRWGGTPAQYQMTNGPVSALIYEGPALPRRLARGLSERAKSAGFSSISEAVGSARD